MHKEICKKTRKLLKSMSNPKHASFILNFIFHNFSSYRIKLSHSAFKHRF